MLFSRNTNPVHNIQIIPFLTSRFFERAAFYGLSSFVFYRLTEINILSGEDIRANYNIFSTYLFIAILLGAILGDLILGNKKAMLFGGIIITGGIFALSLPSANGFIYGLILWAIGNGLYAPNLLAGFVRQYRNNEKVLEAGFILMMLMVNLGGLIGPLLVFSIQKNDFSSSFWIAGMLMTVAIVIGYFAKYPKIESQKNYSFSQNILKIFIFILTTGFFWYLLNGYMSSIATVKFKVLENTQMVLSAENTEYYFIFFIILSIILAFLFSFFYIQRYVKIIIGISLALLAYKILFSINLRDNQSFIKIIIFSNFAIVLAELLITPTLYALIQKYGNSKYYAIYFALMYFPLYLFSQFLGQAHIKSIQEMFDFFNLVSIPALMFMLIFIFLFWQSRRKIN